MRRPDNYWSNRFSLHWGVACASHQSWHAFVFYDGAPYLEIIFGTEINRRWDSATIIGLLGAASLKLFVSVHFIMCSQSLVLYESTAPPPIRFGAQIVHQWNEATILGYSSSNSFQHLVSVYFVMSFPKLVFFDGASYPTCLSGLLLMRKWASLTTIFCLVPLHCYLLFL